MTRTTAALSQLGSSAKTRKRLTRTSKAADKRAVVTRWDRLMPNRIMYLTLLVLCCFGSISAQSQQPPDNSKVDSDRTNDSLNSDPIAEAEKLALALGDVDLKKRRDAAYQLATMGKAASPAIDALIDRKSVV